jgi:lipid-binding SYLF domain-containing protein
VRLIIATTVATTLAFTPQVARDNEPAKRLDDAAAVFSEVMAAPDKGIPQELLENAHCIVIVPELKTAAFGVGGKYGKGYLSCRNKGGAGLVGARHGSHRRRQRGFSDRRFVDGLDHVDHERTGSG